MRNVATAVSTAGNAVMSMIRVCGVCALTLAEGESVQLSGML